VARRNVDEAARELERRVAADPQDLAALDTLTARRARSQTPTSRAEWLAAWAEWRAAGADQWHGGLPRPESPSSQEIAAIHDEFARELRRLDPRIRRSKRRSWHELAAWAEQVLGKERVDEVRTSFTARIQRIVSEQRARLERAQERLAVLAPLSRPELGPEREWRQESYSDSPFNEEFQRKESTTLELIAIARRLGVPARAVHERGRWEPLYDRWRHGYTAGAGFRIYASVAHEADLHLLDIHANAYNERCRAAFDKMFQARQDVNATEYERLWREYQAEQDTLRREGAPHVTEAPPAAP
jgi:hypothetical protein